ncbi:MAG: prepilin-type N-terminal cleavage/methylation domain-containing protein [Nitratireductor sp.]|nr:prepilin-type N-terminal cleavage/methylation domain-containing protein [Nitratireductor sp.]
MNGESGGLESGKPKHGKPKHGKPESGGQEAGFTLIEVVIAFTILTLALAVAMQTVSRTGMTFRRSGTLETVTSAAETVLALVRTGTGAPRTQGVLEDGTRWSVTREEIPDRREQKLFALRIAITPADGGRPYDFLTFAASSAE